VWPFEDNFLFFDKKPNILQNIITYSNNHLLKMKHKTWIYAQHNINLTNAISKLTEIII